MSGDERVTIGVSTKAKVYLRVRPPTAAEKQANDCHALEIEDETTVVAVTSAAGANMTAAERQVATSQGGNARQHRYHFDKVFPSDSTQQSVYDVVAKDNVMNCLEGYHTLVMAYGQTGTGKTHTISNDTPGEEGVLYRSLKNLWQTVEETREVYEYDVSCQHVQLYCEVLSDLLGESDDTLKKQVVLREHPSIRDAVVMKDCATVELSSFEQSWDTFLKGDQRRVVASTMMNRTSSRSHTVFFLNISRRRKLADADYNDDQGQDQSHGRLILVDLAGSERVGKTGATGQLLQEAQKINQSLLSLGRVVQALAQQAESKGKNAVTHVPFRDSKLTRLLQYSMSGKGQSSIIVTVGPAIAQVEETISSIKFGQRARTIQVVAEVHKTVDWKAMALKYEAMLSDGVDKAVREALELQRKDYEHQIKKLHLQIEELMLMNGSKTVSPNATLTPAQAAAAAAAAETMAEEEGNEAGRGDGKPASTSFAGPSLEAARTTEDVASMVKQLDDSRVHELSNDAENLRKERNKLERDNRLLHVKLAALNNEHVELIDRFDDERREHFTRLVEAQRGLGAAEAAELRSRVDDLEAQRVELEDTLSELSNKLLLEQLNSATAASARDADTSDPFATSRSTATSVSPRPVFVGQLHIDPAASEHTINSPASLDAVAPTDSAVADFFSDIADKNEATRMLVAAHATRRLVDEVNALRKQLGLGQRCGHHGSAGPESPAKQL